MEDSPSTSAGASSSTRPRRLRGAGPRDIPHQRGDLPSTRSIDLLADEGEGGGRARLCGAARAVANAVYNATELARARLPDHAGQASRGCRRRPETSLGRPWDMERGGRFAGVSERKADLSRNTSRSSGARREMIHVKHGRQRSDRARWHGGAGRTRTSNQTVMSALLLRAHPYAKPARIAAFGIKIRVCSR